MVVVGSALRSFSGDEYKKTLFHTLFSLLSAGFIFLRSAVRIGQTRNLYAMKYSRTFSVTN